MAKQPQSSVMLLRWSDHVPASDVQDPLGLGLRGSTRLASRLLFCITSITPRARYFSFIPWCVLDYQKREKEQSYALGLADAIAMREKALTLACIAHHEGEACVGGALVGSRKAASWFTKGRNEADFKRLSFAKVPALNAYFNSLVNLGCFVTQDELPDSDEQDEERQMTFDDIELSPLGLDLAQRYESLVGRLKAVRQLSSFQRKCSMSSLAEWGKRGGLCELADVTAPDRQLLRDIFFSRVASKGESHPVRKQSLLLILELCRQLSAEGWSLGEPEFASAVYFGEIVSDDGRIRLTWPEPLVDIATRWRMFYFHHFMSVALEGMFAWLVSQLAEKGVGGATIESLASGLDGAAVSKALSEQFGCKVGPSFGQQTPKNFFTLFGVPLADLDVATSRTVDGMIGADSLLAENWLEDLIRSNEFLYSPVGLAVPMILLSLTLARYTQWETTNYGHWLATVANDPYLDLIPPVLTSSLSRRFGEWWACSWKELATFVLSRFVVQQHQAMSYEKSAAGDRCLFQVDGLKVITADSFDKIGMGNPRFRSAVQVLKDLALLQDIEDGTTIVTPEGRQLLDEELAKMAEL